MEKTLLSEKEWCALMMDTPFGISKEAARRKETAFCTPGCCVKAKRRNKEQGGFPEDYGRLHQYGDKVVVISHDDRILLHPEKSRCKWEGTVGQYEDMWECD